MGIIDYWRDTDIPIEKTCPECAGTGKDNFTLDWVCGTCNGIGKIYVKEDCDSI